MFGPRKTTINSHAAQTDIIAWRGHEITRIEAFSDAVFALAVTLLAVSMDVPKTFDELTVALRGFLPFAVCFILFFQVWTAQNQFFRRFGLHDEVTIRLNAILLFAMLFFVYPLKFLFSVLFLSAGQIGGNQMQLLMYIYGAGFMIIYVLLGLMYHHAHGRREHLKLTDREAFETQTEMYRNFGIGSVGLLSMAIATIRIPGFLILSGISYSVISIVVSVIGKRRRGLAKKLFKAERVQRVLENEPHGERVEE